MRNIQNIYNFNYGKINDYILKYHLRKFKFNYKDDFLCVILDKLLSQKFNIEEMIKFIGKNQKKDYFDSDLSSSEEDIILKKDKKYFMKENSNKKKKVRKNKIDNSFTRSIKKLHSSVKKRVNLDTINFLSPTNYSVKKSPIIYNNNFSKNVGHKSHRIINKYSKLKNDHLNGKIKSEKLLKVNNLRIFLSNNTKIEKNIKNSYLSNKKKNFKKSKINSSSQNKISSNYYLKRLENKNLKYKNAKKLSLKEYELKKNSISRKKIYVSSSGKQFMQKISNGSSSYNQLSSYLKNDKEKKYSNFSSDKNSVVKILNSDNNKKKNKETKKKFNDYNYNFSKISIKSPLLKNDSFNNYFHPKNSSLKTPKKYYSRNKFNEKKTTIKKSLEKNSIINVERIYHKYIPNESREKNNRVKKFSLLNNSKIDYNVYNYTSMGKF